MDEAGDQVGDEAFTASMEKRFKKVFGIAPSPEEVRSWRLGWPALVAALCAAGLRAVNVLLNYSVPATGERVDALLVGTMADGRLCVVAIELKHGS
ncbi:hypothetical protein ACFW3D_40325 [Streptomyces sp. NPDC058864]